MEKELVLGIDYGGKYTGLAVVDRRNNQVLYARTVKMRDDVTKPVWESPSRECRFFGSGL
jgi:hypothetical protein